MLCIELAYIYQSHNYCFYQHPLLKAQLNNKIKMNNKSQLLYNSTKIITIEM